jgi:MoaA/NifB/PqqE/SkfB family radical SAM enzyme
MRFDPASKLVRSERFNIYMNGFQIAPQLVEISPTGLCNAKCDWCFYKGTKSKDSIAEGVLEEVLREMKKLGVKAVNWTGGGEPTLHEKFDELTDVARDQHLRQGLFTNALEIPTYEPSKFDWIRVSKTNRPFNEEALKYLRDHARTVGLTINYDGDLGEVERSLDLADRLNLDYVQVRPALGLYGKTTLIHPPLIKHPKLQIAEYKFHEAQKRQDYKECEGFHFVPFVWEDGEVNVCAYQKGQVGYVLGNLYLQSFAEIMGKAPKSVPVRGDCQVCCKNHEVNQTIAHARKLEDIDFL